MSIVALKTQKMPKYRISKKIVC